jgi:hypothetical protein
VKGGRHLLVGLLDQWSSFRNLFSSHLEFRMMDKVHKPSCSECFTPSSEPFKLYVCICIIINKPDIIYIYKCLIYGTRWRSKRSMWIGKYLYPFYPTSVRFTTRNAFLRTMRQRPHPRKIRRFVRAIPVLQHTAKLHSQKSIYIKLYIT